MKEWRLAIILGFEFDIMLSATRLAYSGILERFPELNFVIAHLGAGIPFLVGRIDRGYHDPMCGVKTKKPTSEYLKDLHTDAVCFYKPTLMMAYDFFGAERIVMGSDFRFRSETWKLPFLVSSRWISLERQKKRFWEKMSNGY